MNLPAILDYEIWKASHMLSQTSPYDDEAESKNDPPKVDVDILKNTNLIANHVTDERVVVVKIDR